MTARNGKPCKRCGTSEWYDSGNCKHCSRERSRKWKVQNPERNKEITQEWRDNNRERMYEHSRRWHKENPDKVNRVKRRWRKRHPEKQKRAQQNWAKNNPEKVSAKAHRYRARKLSNGGSYTVEQWHRLCKKYDNQCAVPGCDRTDLEPDHVVPISKGGSNDITNIQPLCVHHNRSKSDKIIDYRKNGRIKSWIQRRLFS